MLSLSELTRIRAYPRLTGTCGVIYTGFDGAPGLLYQTERKPDLPVSRRVGSELSVRSLLNQQLLVSRFTNLRVCAIRLSGVRLPVFGRELGFVYDVCHKFANIHYACARLVGLVGLLIRVVLR